VDCNPIWWIAIQFGGLQSNLVDWIVTIQFCNFNTNPKLRDYFIKKLKFPAPTMKPSNKLIIKVVSK